MTKTKARKKRAKSLNRSWCYLRRRKHYTLRWVTIIIGAIRLRRADVWQRDGRQKVIADVVRMAEEYRSTWRGLTLGRHLSGMTWRGALEIGLEREIVSGSHSHTTLTAMGLDASPLAPDERMLILHCHLVIAADVGCDVCDAQTAEAWATRVRAVLRTTWPGGWRTMVQALWAEDVRSLADSIQNLSSYVAKQRLEYADVETGWGGVATRYAGQFEMVWHALVGGAYRSMDVELRSRR